MPSPYLCNAYGSYIDISSFILYIIYLLFPFFPSLTYYDNYINVFKEPCLVLLILSIGFLNESISAFTAIISFCYLDLHCFLKTN